MTLLLPKFNVWTISLLIQHYLIAFHFLIPIISDVWKYNLHYYQSSLQRYFTPNLLFHSQWSATFRPYEHYSVLQTSQRPSPHVVLTAFITHSASTLPWILFSMHNKIHSSLYRAQSIQTFGFYSSDRTRYWQLKSNHNSLVQLHLQSPAIVSTVGLGMVTDICEPQYCMGLST